VVRLADPARPGHYCTRVQVVKAERQTGVGCGGIRLKCDATVRRLTLWHGDNPVEPQSRNGLASTIGWPC